MSGAHVVWGRWKSQVYLSPYVEKPLNSKAIKSFVPEQRSRKFLMFRDSYVIYVRYGHYKHSMYISRSHIMAVLHIYRKNRENQSVAYFDIETLSESDILVKKCLQMG